MMDPKEALFTREVWERMANYKLEQMPVYTGNYLTLDGNDEIILDATPDYHKMLQKSVTDFMERMKSQEEKWRGPPTPQRFRGYVTNMLPDSSDIVASRNYEDGTTFICRGGKAVFVPV